MAASKNDAERRMNIRSDLCPSSPGGAGRSELLRNERDVHFKHNMSNHIKRTKTKQSKVPLLLNTTTVLITTLAVMIVLGFGWWKSKHASKQLTAPTNQTQSNQDTPATKTTSDFSKLIGKWLRPDGGYILEIKSVEESGKIEALYSNPQPIHVSRAEASQDGTSIKVFVELRDVNYPGSTYDLNYEPQNDQLKGGYYQAAIKQTFEVFFVRIK